MPNDKYTSKIDFLLVDDDEVFCTVLHKAIERRGYTILSATNSADAIKLANNHRPTHAIVDLCIGSESGLTLVKNLVVDNPDICIVMLTGYSSIATAVQAMKLGATHYLTKPADADEIISSFNDKNTEDVKVLKQPISPKRLEWEHLQKVLLDNNGNISATARDLGMHRRTLQRKLQKRPVKN